MCMQVRVKTKTCNADYEKKYAFYPIQKKKKLPFR